MLEKNSANKTTGEDGDKFYVVEQGECDVFSTKSGVSQHVAALIAGSAFGELALIYGSPRTATVKVSISLFNYKRYETNTNSYSG